ncbi:hypothetical protein BKI52_39270 [marine bacterium AO1-C]|nr:hypothetical protein BKI52_39270 [marine bacterium AO1-C]
MKLFYKILVISFLWITFSAHQSAIAQNIQYSQFHHSPIMLNPATVAMKNEMLVMLNYRTQFTQAGQAFSTPMFSFVLPFISKQDRVSGTFGKVSRVHRWGGLGVSLLQDSQVAGDQTKLQTTGGHLTYAHNLDIGGLSHWSMGMQVGYFNRRLVADFTTESQFVYGGIDPSLPTNENLVGNSVGFATFSAGTMVYSDDKHARIRNYLGISIYNFNQPNVTFFERAAGQNTDLLPARMIVTGGWRVFDNDQMTIQPNARWILQGKSSQVNVGALGKFYPKHEEDPYTSLGFGLWYSLDNAMIFSFEYYNPHFIIGLSYDLRFGSSLPLNESNGIPEISLAFRKIIKHKRKLYRASID